MSGIGKNVTLVNMRFLVTRLVCTASMLIPVLTAQSKNFSGAEALEYTRKAVALGPRPDGSAAIASLRRLIHQQLTLRGCEVIGDKFNARTPDGPLEMENIICKFPGKSGRAIAITGHYDTKKMDKFVGANDGGSSTGFLLEMAAALQGKPRTDDLYLVFFDGEEAVRDWSETDSLYGSRRMVEKWGADGTLRRLKALINIDMIGDKNLTIMWDSSSAQSVRKLIWDVADSLGYTSSFERDPKGVDDDHIPFVQAGVRAVDLIDFESQGKWWHTPGDAMDKLSAHSFEVVGNVVIKTIVELEQQK